MHDSERLDQIGVQRRHPDQKRSDAADGGVHLPTQMGNREFTRHVANPPVQRAAERSQGAGPLDPDIESSIRQAQGGGRPLAEPVRADMESHLGMDLSAVRVHADSRGDALSRSVQADAFTTGTDVFFRSGRYAPDSGDGRRLLAHELTHVVQQSTGVVPAESRVSHPDDPHEVQARAVADSLGSAPMTGGGSAVQRETAEDEEDMPVSRQQAPDEQDLEEA